MMSQCNKCGASLKPYWLKNGTCNGCLNPHLIVEVKRLESLHESEITPNEQSLLNELANELELKELL
jgi:hypothetical protein